MSEPLPRLTPTEPENVDWLKELHSSSRKWIVDGNILLYSEIGLGDLHRWVKLKTNPGRNYSVVQAMQMFKGWVLADFNEPSAAFDAD